MKRRGGLAEPMIRVAVLLLALSCLPTVLAGPASVTAEAEADLPHALTFPTRVDCLRAHAQATVDPLGSADPLRWVSGAGAGFGLDCGTGATPLPAPSPFPLPGSSPGNVTILPAGSWIVGLPAGPSSCAGVEQDGLLLVGDNLWAGTDARGWLGPTGARVVRCA